MNNDADNGLQDPDSDYDFGKFDELDSDLDSQPEVEQDSLDPFTAALKTEAVNAEEVEDRAVFTQRLFNNAQTLRQLSQDGPAIEIEYAKEEPEPPVIISQRSLPSRQSSNLSQKYIKPSRDLYESVLLLPEGSSVPAKHVTLSAEVFRSLTYQQFCAVLEYTRHYQLTESNSSPCIQELWAGSDVTSALVMQVVSIKDNKVVLKDDHASPCQVLAVLQVTLSIDVGSRIKITDCYFDHAVKIEPDTAQSASQIPSAQHPKFSSGLKFPDHVPSSYPAPPNSLVTAQPTSVLVVNRAELYRLNPFDGGDTNIQSTAETSYSDQIDLTDFPVELLN